MSKGMNDDYREPILHWQINWLVQSTEIRVKIKLHLFQYYTMLYS